MYVQSEFAQSIEVLATRLSRFMSRSENDVILLQLMEDTHGLKDTKATRTFSVQLHKEAKALGKTLPGLWLRKTVLALP